MKNLDYKSSLIGFHNPYTHKGLTPKEFLDAYIRSQQRKFKKKDGWRRKRLVDWILAHYDSQLKFVQRLFPTTLAPVRKKRR